MRVEVWSLDDHLIETLDAEPLCGEDFCDRCGDCLKCFDADAELCPNGHRWVLYTDANDDRIAQIRATTGGSDDGQ